MIVNPIAALGFEGEASQGNNDFYDTNRPSYPKEAMEGVYKAVLKGVEGRKEGDLRVLELGSGTVSPTSCR